MNIKISVRNKLPICGDVAIVCNNSDYTVIWELGEEWAAYDTKTMRTAYQDGTYTDTVFTGNTVALPVVTVPGQVKIGLYAGDIRTSRPALIRALPSITSDGGTPADPPEDVYNQIMELIKKMETVSPEDIAKAVEDYLTEHPAAAASMRVEGGYIQFSADGKTWANVIALADLKGAPGKDGAGMDVTGAAVGQIAKITAVDTDGKPTAWEPVDMPAGGEEPSFNFDLIVDHTVTEEDLTVSMLTWTNETIPNLGKYNLFYAVIESDTEFGLTKWVKFHINGASVAQLSGSSTPKCKKIPVGCNRFFGKWIGTSVYNPVNSAPFSVLTGPCENAYSYQDAISTAEDATSIGMGSYAADFGLVEGMHIRVYAMV